MILDKLAEFCDATALNTGGAGTYTLGNQIDTQVVNSFLANGEPVYLVIRVATTATSGGSATGTFLVVTDDAVDLSSGTTLATSQTFTVASMLAGVTILAIALPYATYLRYLGIRQTTATAAFTAGAVDAFLTKDPSFYRAYANAI